MIFIFIDHIPYNILSIVTLQSVVFFDAAEIFIFISGYTAAFVYGRRLATQGAQVLGLVIDADRCQVVAAGLDGLMLDDPIDFPTPDTYLELIDALAGQRGIGHYLPPTFRM